MNARYAFELPKGVVYSTQSGPLRKKLEEQFGGLRRFRFPFIDSYKPTYSTRYLNLFLVHGLDGETSLDDIPLQLIDTKTKEVPFRLQILVKSLWN